MYCATFQAHIYTSFKIMFDSTVFSIFDTLNQLFSVIGTVYVYAVAIALPLCILQSAYVRYVNTVSDEFYQQVTDQTADSLGSPQASVLVKVALAVEPEEKKAPPGIALVSRVFGGKLPTEKPTVISVEQDIKPALNPEIVRNFWADIDFGKMNIRAIRDYVKAQSLQQLIKEAIGKTYPQCTLAELRSALIESQAIDRQFDRHREIAYPANLGFEK